MSAPTKVLMIEDDPVSIRIYSRYLVDQPYAVSVAETGRDGLAQLRSQKPDVLLLDLLLPDMDGFDVLKAVAEARLPTAAVIITSEASMNRAIEAMRLGAKDYLVKPCTRDRLLTTLANLAERQQLRREVQRFQQDFERRTFFGFTGSSPGMQQLYRTIERTSTSKAPVFITGESGTGKEVCAEAIHRASERADGPFVAVNCAAIPRDLIESEIFGHLKGAFTGAGRDRDGAARQADGGTLFLDEICEMEPDLQPKLLRFLQTSGFQRLGGSQQETVDVRIICATNRDPLQAVAENRLREDLYYRINVLPIHLPPLRQRGGDVIEIAVSFLQRFSTVEGKRLGGFDQATTAILSAYDWPGNVRQLQNVVHNIVVLNDGDQVTSEMLPEPLAAFARDVAAHPRATGADPAPQSAAHPAGPVNFPGFGEETGSYERRIRPMSEIERDVIERAISICAGNVPMASRYLGISPATLYRKKAKWRQEQ